MSFNQWISFLSVLGLYLFIFGTAFAAFEGGFLFGKYHLKHRHKERNSLVAPMVGSTLGLLAFMLSFSFGIAGSHFDARRQYVIDEANSIRTAYYMTSFLPEASALESRELLREYVGLRLGKLKSYDHLQLILERSNEIQDQLWAIAMECDAKPTKSSSAWLYAERLTKVFNIQVQRVIYGTSRRIQFAIWAVLWSITILGMASMGYQAGLSGVRGFFVYIVLIITFTTVIILVYDLDQPKPLLFKVNQDAMIDLHKQMSSKAVPVLPPGSK